MCAHANGSPEDCALAGDPVTGNLICVAHPQQPIPRQRDDDADLLVAEMQRALAE